MKMKRLRDEGGTWEYIVELRRERKEAQERKQEMERKFAERNRK